MKRLFPLISLALLGLAACQEVKPPKSPSASPTVSPAMPSTPGAASTLPPDDFRSALAQIDKSHHDKMKLAWYVLSPFRSVDPAFKPYYQDMQTNQKALAETLESWAKAHHIDLAFKYDNTVFGLAQKIMEDRQSRVAQSDQKTDFERDMLINMHMDYEFQISLIQALLPAVKDTALTQYLQHNLHTAEAASMQTTNLLKRYKFQ